MYGTIYFKGCGLIVLSEFFGFNLKSKKKFDSKPIGIEVTLYHLAYYAKHGIFAVLNKTNSTYEIRVGNLARKSFKNVFDQEPQQCVFRHQFESARLLCLCRLYISKLELILQMLLNMIALCS